MLLEKDSDGRLKRIEYRGKYLRASRTGGVALRAQARAGGINFTANTNRGARVSTRIAKGTQAAFQNGRFVLRGRYAYEQTSGLNLGNLPTPIVETGQFYEDSLKNFATFFILS